MQDDIPQWFLDAWPKCAVPACPNKCCRALRSRYCWQHTPGTPQQAADNLLEAEPRSADVAGHNLEQL